MKIDKEAELKQLQEKQTATEEIFDGIILHVVRDTVDLPNGHSSVREVIRHIGAVCVIPVTENNEVIVERQYRYPLDRVILEIPAGKLDSPDEDRLSAIQRELREETGYSADEWMNIGDFHPAPAYSDEYITMYLARGLHKGKQDLDADEFLNVYTIPLKDLVDDVMSGKISDAKTQVAVLKAARILNI
jgi:ADP-ribose pyrophosphatase